MLPGHNGTLCSNLGRMGHDDAHGAVLVDHSGLNGRDGVTSYPLISLGLLPKNPMIRDGFKKGFGNPVAMANGNDFIGTKA